MENQTFTMESEDVPIHQLIIYRSVFLISFVIGLCLQIRVIKRLKQEKMVAADTQMYHSISLIICFSVLIFQEALLYIIPDIINYSGWQWICEIFRYMQILGGVTISWHSLSVAIQKYIVIVHGVVDNSDRRKIEKIMWWIFLVLEILWSAGRHIKESTLSHIESNSPPENCFSRKTVLRFLPYSKVSFLCTFNANSDYLANGYFLYFMTELYCAIHFTISGILLLNIIEAFVYLGIFHFSKR
jgi:hypothetical protein